VRFEEEAFAIQSEANEHAAGSFPGQIPGCDQCGGWASHPHGASFRFRVTREHVVQTSDASTYNPLALPERTIQEARVMEFGPCTFPAYQGATAGVRSLTDWYLSTRDLAAA
jgi:hypothetical protein